MNEKWNNSEAKEREEESLFAQKKSLSFEAAEDFVYLFFVLFCFCCCCLLFVKMELTDKSTYR